MRLERSDQKNSVGGHASTSNGVEIVREQVLDPNVRKRLLDSLRVAKPLANQLAALGEHNPG